MSFALGLRAVRRTLVDDKTTQRKAMHGNTTQGKVLFCNQTQIFTQTLTLNRCNSFGTSPFENERRLNMRTISDTTRQRLTQKVEEMHGRVVHNLKAKVKCMQTEKRAKVARLVSEKKNLVQAVKEAAQESKQSMNTAKAKHRQHVTQLRVKVKSVKKLAKEMQEAEEKAARQRLKEVVTKLEEDKDALREHARKQRTGFKAALHKHEAKEAALELKGIELRMGAQKTARVMATKELVIESLEEQLLRKDFEKDSLVLQAKVKADELAVAELAVVACKEAHKHVDKRAKAAERKVQDLRRKVEMRTERKLRHTQQIQRLEESLQKATEVSILPKIRILAYLLSKITFAFVSSYRLTGKNRGCGGGQEILPKVRNNEDRVGCRACDGGEGGSEIRDLGATHG